MIHIAKPIIGDEEINAVINVLKSGNLASSSQTKIFEENFANYIKSKYAIATNSGTSALHASLLSIGIKQGDEVIVPDFSFVATGSAVAMCGAKPIFADVDINTYNIDPKSVEKLITNRTKAIIGVHLFGNPFFADELLRICDENKICLVEDSAQAHGATYNNTKTGNIGDVGCFSFYATKNMNTAEGGMITTSNSEISESVKLIVNHGQSTKYTHDILGYNYRLTDICAAIGIEQLKKLDQLNLIRQRNAKLYDEHLSAKGIIKPQITDGCRSVYHQYAIRITDDYKLTRDQLMKYLANNGISTAIHYPKPISAQPLFSHLQNPIQTPVSKRLSCEILSIPVHPLVTSEEIEYICNTINEVKK